MLLSKCVLSNTDLDNKEQIQVGMNKRNYKNAEYDHNIIGYLMKYLELELRTARKFLKIPIYN